MVSPYIPQSGENDQDEASESQSNSSQGDSTVMDPAKSALDQDGSEDPQPPIDNELLRELEDFERNN